VHLIRDHHYFEGNTEYRLDPNLAIEVLEIKPGIDYRLKVIGDQAWKGIAYMGPFDQETLLAAKKYQIEDFQSESREFEAYLLPYKDFSSYRYRGLTHKQKIEKEGLENKKSREQIDKDIEAYIEFEKMFANCAGESITSTINEQIWQSDGNNYLHVFTFKHLLDNNKIYDIGNAVISSVDIRPPNELTVYKSIKSTIPILEKDDYVK
jgi:hypothetical protein